MKQNQSHLLAQVELLVLAVDLVAHTVADLVHMFDTFRALDELVLHALLLGVDGRVRGVRGQAEKLCERTREAVCVRGCEEMDINKIE